MIFTRSLLFILWVQEVPIWLRSIYILLNSGTIRLRIFSFDDVVAAVIVY